MTTGGGKRTVPTELAALAMGVSSATIRKWASRGKITRLGSAQRAEYDLDELYRLRQTRHPEAPSRARTVDDAADSDPD